MAEIGHMKRLLELWEADESFRRHLEDSPREAAQQYGLLADAEAMRPVWDAHWAPDQPVASCVERYRSFVREKFAHRDELRQTSRPLSQRFHAWRQRQMTRTFSQLGPSKAHGIVHPLAAFELSKGCSVGCWFCGISAPKLGDIFAYNDANRGLWRDVCQVWREEVGQAAEQAFLYWATDPMDNPDFEKFSCDFHEICGHFPQTTTALPLRDIERTRRLLRLSEERGCLLNRFSILNLRILKGVHEAFRAEELTFVELVMQMAKELPSKAVAGRALEKALRQGQQEISTSTIACVSGFLINMLEGSIRLISPCPASERWPLGYQIFAEGHFATAEEFRRQLLHMTSEEVMPASIRFRQRVSLRQDLTCSLSPRGLTVSSPHLHQIFRGLADPSLDKLGRMLSQRSYDAESIALEVDPDLAQVFLVLNQMLAAGVLEEASL